MLTVKDIRKKCRGRLCSQYYYNSKCIDGQPCCYKAIDEKDMKKIRVSWNVGLGESFTSKESSYKKLNDIFTPEFTRPGLYRKYDIQYKGSLNYSIYGY